MQLTFELTNECDEDEFVDSQLEALGGIAELMRNQVNVGGFGAYLVDTNTMDEDEDGCVEELSGDEEETKYYLVK